MARVHVQAKGDEEEDKVKVKCKARIGPGLEEFESQTSPQSPNRVFRVLSPPVPCDEPNSPVLKSSKQSPVPMFKKTPRRSSPCMFQRQQSPKHKTRTYPASGAEERRIFEEKKKQVRLSRLAKNLHVESIAKPSMKADGNGIDFIRDEADRCYLYSLSEFQREVSGY